MEVARMEAASATVRELQEEVAALKRELAAIRDALSARGFVPTRRNRESAQASSRAVGAAGIVRQAGLLGGLTPGDKIQVAEWRKRPVEERAQIRREQRAKQFDLMLSQIIIENRR